MVRYMYVHTCSETAPSWALFISSQSIFPSWSLRRGEGQREGGRPREGGREGGRERGKRGKERGREGGEEEDKPHSKVDILI